LLLQALERKSGDAKTTGPVIGILGHLLELSPALFTKAYCVFQYDSEAEKDCKALVAVLESLRMPDALFKEGLERLARKLEHVAAQSDWLGILSALAAIHHCAAQGGGEDWTRWRQPTFAALRRLTDIVFARAKWDSAVKPVVEGLGALLPRGAVPVDEEKLEDRIRWIEHAQKHLDAKRAETNTPIPDTHPWHEQLNHILYHTHKALQKLLNWERKHVLLQVRPHLELMSSANREEREEGHFVRLRLRATPEGQRELHDVSIRFDSEGENGLLAPGERRHAIDMFVYPGRFSVQEFELNGFIRRGQETVCVRARLRGGSGYESNERWCFSLPALAASKPGVFTVPQALPLVYEQFFKALISSKDPVILAVFDEDLGRDSFIEDWERRFPGWRFDLDSTLKDIGTGRTYGARPLDAALIIQVIDQAIAQVGVLGKHMTSSPRAFLVGPTDDVIERLLRGEAPGALQAWWAALQERTTRKVAPCPAVALFGPHS
jgi:hypothetical protein